MNLQISPDKLPEQPSRERIESQCVEWSYQAQKRALAGNAQAAASITDTINKALVGYRGVYGDQAATELSNQMDAAQRRARLEHEDAKTGTPPTRNRRTARAILIGLLAAELVLLSMRLGHCAEPPASSPPAAAKKKPGKDKPGKCEAGQSSTIHTDGSVHCTPKTTCPKGQTATQNTDGTVSCGCTGGQVYNEKAEKCETIN